jgi:DNA-binding XRE family transcriptional regulator
MTKDKNIAGSKDNRIKALEAKMNKNIAGGMAIQTELVFEVEVEKEINGVQMGVLKGGTPYLTQTGLAKLCGVPRKTIYNIDQELNAATQGKAKERADKIKELLTTQGYIEKDLFIKIRNGADAYNAYPDSVCMGLLEYFAFEENKRAAQQSYRILARSSFRSYIYNLVGYKSETKQLDNWKFFLDRVDLNFDVVPDGYFSIFKEVSGLTVSLIKGGIIIDDHTIPDGSVGGCWGRYWTENQLEKEFGVRVRYEHNFPEYFPQALSNPQETWCYPDNALKHFRQWFKAEYIFSKFPDYLLRKVKSLSLTHEQKNKILEAVRPKEIEIKTENDKVIAEIRKDYEGLNNANFEEKLEKISLKNNQ